MSEDIPQDNNNNLQHVKNKSSLLQYYNVSEIKSLSKPQLANTLENVYVYIEELMTKISQIESDKNELDKKMHQTLLKVAKWQNDKNMLLNFMKQQNSNNEQNMIQSIVETLDLLNGFKGNNEQMDKMLVANIQKIMTKFNITEVEGLEFDPTTHVAEGKLDKGEKIEKYLKKGYYYKGKIVRYASVLLN